MPTKTKPKLVIDRKKWIRQGYKGVNSPISKLRIRKILTTSGKDPFAGQMCCLGFACRQIGRLAASTIDGIGGPGGLSTKVKTKIANSPLGFLMKWNEVEKDYHNSRKGISLMAINDNPKTTDKFKETRIKEIFAEQGIKVQFIN